MCRPLGEPGRIHGRPILLDPPANDRLGELRCPVLAVAGQLDVSDVVQTAQRLEAAAPNARAVVWPEVAHMIGMEAPDRLNSLIVDFLAPLRPWR
jgi:pimeloyl-ACP methyl ester carboxylesterase